MSFEEAFERLCKGAPLFTAEELQKIRDHYVRQMKDLGIWSGKTDSHDEWRDLNSENSV